MLNGTTGDVSLHADVLKEFPRGTNRDIYIFNTRLTFVLL